jgi:hypothetical protein
MKKLLWVVVLAVAVYAGYQHHEARPGGPATTATASNGGDTRSAPSTRTDAGTGPAQVQGSGVVVRILPDDDEGSRHQRFILRLPSGQTVLVAHNIDLAPRIDDLKKGDVVEYSGEYVWNPKGGVLHWTHRDPSGRHVAGWLRHDGRTYQ